MTDYELAAAMAGIDLDKKPDPRREPLNDAIHAVWSYHWEGSESSGGTAPSVVREWKVYDAMFPNGLVDAILAHDEATR